MTPTLNLGILGSGVVLPGGPLYGWGANVSGEIGDGTTTQRNTPVQVGSSISWTAVAPNSGVSRGIESSKVFRWGESTTSPTQVGSDTGWTDISVAKRNDAHTLAIQGGKLYAWGVNGDGQLGDGTTTTRTNPVQIGSWTDWEAVMAMSNGGFVQNSRSVGIRGGKLYRWGNGTTSPTQIGSDTDWTYLSKGGVYLGFLAVEPYAIRGGKLYQYSFSENTLEQVGSDTDWAAVASGGGFYIAIKTNGKLYGYGSNSAGQLGDGTKTDRYSNPVQIGSDTDWSVPAAGQRHSGAIKTNGKLYAWGGNYNGEVGDSTTTERLSPVQVGSATDWTLVRAGASYTMGVR